MRFTPTNKESYPVAPLRQRCIWMSAGILSYQLCDREFDCDRCPLDRAMRMHFSSHHGEHRPAPGAGEGAADRRLYSRDHSWTLRTGEGVVRVGLEPSIASVLVDAKEVVLPPAGAFVSPGGYCCWIILPGGSVPLRSPVSGRVVRTNACVAAEPHQISASPMDRGWLFEVQPDPGLREERLLEKAEAEELYAGDSARFKDLLLESLRVSPEEVGFTMADGGQLLHDALGLLGPERYCNIVLRAFLGVER